MIEYKVLLIKDGFKQRYFNKCLSFVSFGISEWISGTTKLKRYDLDDTNSFL